MLHDDLNEAGQPLGRLDDYEVADGYPDVRGWTVRTAGGQELGTVRELVVDTAALEVTHLDVALADDARLADAAGAREGALLVPIEQVQLDRDSDSVLVSGGLYGAAPLAAADTAAAATTAGLAGVAATDRDDVRAPRAGEELAIDKRRAAAGQIGIRRRLEAEPVSGPVTAGRDEVTVERPPVVADSAADLTRENDRVEDARTGTAPRDRTLDDEARGL